MESLPAVLTIPPPVLHPPLRRRDTIPSTARSNPERPEPDAHQRLGDEKGLEHGPCGGTLVVKAVSTGLAGR